MMYPSPIEPEIAFAARAATPKRVSCGLRQGTWRLNSAKRTQKCAMTIDEKTFSFAPGDGETIRAYRWQANPVRAVLQIAHGMGEHSRRYLEPLTPLIESGIAVYANDHRGHGATAASKADLGDFGPRGFAALADDMATLTRLI